MRADARGHSVEIRTGAVGHEEGAQAALFALLLGEGDLRRRSSP